MADLLHIWGGCYDYDDDDTDDERSHLPSLISHLRNGRDAAARGKKDRPDQLVGWLVAVVYLDRTDALIEET